MITPNDINIIVLRSALDILDFSLIENKICLKALNGFKGRTDLDATRYLPEIMYKIKKKISEIELQRERVRVLAKAEKLIAGDTRSQS